MHDSVIIVVFIDLEIWVLDFLTVIVIDRGDEHSSVSGVKNIQIIENLQIKNVDDLGRHLDLDIARGSGMTVVYYYDIGGVKIGGGVVQINNVIQVVIAIRVAWVVEEVVSIMPIFIGKLYEHSIRDDVVRV